MESGTEKIWLDSLIEIQINLKTYYFKFTRCLKDRQVRKEQSNIEHF